ncbi:MAG: fumarylacetoacetate hydrolase family protein [Solirubrobacterales bacterium]|nr:fumarylacetoacetate hydrolase family protein [Solirubrobacterales bacterium]
MYSRRPESGGRGPLFEGLPATGRVRVRHDGAPSWGRLEGDRITLDAGPQIAPEIAEWLAPVEPSKILAVHLTYRSRVDEYETATEVPSYFMKPPSALNGHLAEIRRPAETEFLNYEGELAVVIGKRMKGVPQSEALGYVAGYANANDVGLHDFRHADRGSMLRVKGQDGFLPIGPAVVGADQFDPGAFELRTLVNGEIVQTGDQDDLMFGVDYMLADLCRLITLEPGDVVLTGTPANSRPMEPGDLVEVEISGLGRLSNRVVESEPVADRPGAIPEVSAQTLHVALAIPEQEAESAAVARAGESV